MKKIFIFAILCCLILCGCGTDKDEEVKEETEYNYYDDENVMITYDSEFCKIETVETDEFYGYKFDFKFIDDVPSDVKNTILNITIYDKQKIGYKNAEESLYKILSDRLGIDEAYYIENQEELPKGLHDYDMKWNMSDGSVIYASVISENDNEVMIGVCRLCGYSEEYNSEIYAMFMSASESISFSN